MASLRENIKGNFLEGDLSLKTLLLFFHVTKQHIAFKILFGNIQ